MDSFSSYIDHLILLLAARFQAPLEVSTEELLSRVHGEAVDDLADPWTLVARTVQMNLSSPQTPQERLSMRHLDIHHFSPSVCRERARYMQWKLGEDSRRHQENRRAVRAAAAVAAQQNTAPSVKATAGAAREEAGATSFDITRDSLRNDVSRLYALVRQSLPSTLEDDADGDGDTEETVPYGFTDSATATAAETSSVSVQVREVFVRTEEERLRDEQVARAREEFLSQIQALQTVYYNKYRRWMDAPENVLEPPPPSLLATEVKATVATMSSSHSSRKLSLSVNGGDGAAQKTTINGSSRQLGSHSEADERAALLAALKATPSSTGSAVAAPPPKIRSGAHPTVAAMRRQVYLQRPPRPSAVPEEALEDVYSTAAAPEAVHTTTTTLLKESVKPTVAAPAAAILSGGAAEGKVVAAASPPAPAAASVAAKETAPPVGRRGRWQIVEYDDADDRGE
jgi:hypothetical protein